MSDTTKFSQDRVHAMDNMVMFIISHVTRLWRHKIETKGESQYGQVHLYVHAVLNILWRGRFKFVLLFKYSYFCVSI